MTELVRPFANRSSPTINAPSAIQSAARGHAGAPGHHRRRRSASPSPPGPRHAEPDRVRFGTYPLPEAQPTAHVQGVGRLSVLRRRAGRGSACHWPPSTAHGAHAELLLDLQRQVEGVYVDPRVTPTPRPGRRHAQRSRRRTADGTSAIDFAPAHAPRSTCAAQGPRLSGVVEASSRPTSSTCRTRCPPPHCPRLRASPMAVRPTP